MKPDDDPQVARAVVLFLHRRHGGTQRAFAQDAGVSRDTISQCECGHRAVSRSTLAKLAAAARVKPEHLDALLAVTRAIYGAESAEILRPAPAAPEDDWLGMNSLATSFSRFFERYTEHRLRSLEAARRAPVEVEPAEALWERLSSYPSAVRHTLVVGGEKFQSWELGELLCDQSLALAAEDAAEAVDVATLAVKIATLAPGTQAEQARREAYAWAHLGNALRAKNDLPAADRAFTKVHRLWAGLSERLGEDRVLGLEAALRASDLHF